MTKNNYSRLAATLLALMLFPACKVGASKESTKSPKTEVQVHRAELRNFSADITSFGSIVYTKKNDITTAVDGIIETLDQREGDSVHTGQRVALLSNIQLTIQRDQATSSLKSAEAATKLAEAQYDDYRRQIEARFIGLEKTEIELRKSKRLLEKMNSELQDQKKLLDVGGITEESMRSARFSIENTQADYEMLQKEISVTRIGLRDSDIINAGYAVPTDPEKRRNLLTDLNSLTKKAEVDVTKAQYETAQTNLKSAEALIDELTIVSPIGGIVGAIYKEPGERVASGDKLMTIFSSDDAWVVFPVNESDLYRLRKGMQVIITVQSVQQEPIRGVIDIISPTVDPQSGNVTVKALVKKMGSKGKPGMFAGVTVMTEIPVKKMLIPLSCLAQRQDKNGMIMTVRSGKVFKRKVGLGIEFKGEIEITEGLSSGESVVLEPTPLLREGDEVSTHEK